MITEGKNSNIEILRILAMIMIISYHCVMHGNFQLGGVYYKTLLEILSSGGKIGVNVFCLIMGYFGVESKTNPLSKLIRTEFQVLFVSIVGLIIGACWAFDKVSLGSITRSLFPIITEHYWFFTAYAIILTFSTYLNKAISFLSEKSYIRIIFLMLTVWSIIPFFTLRETSGMFWNQLIWFAIMYIIGAYIKLHSSSIYTIIKHPILVVAVCSFMLILSIIILNILALKILFFAKYTTYFRWSNSPLAVGISISLLLVAIKAGRTSFNMLNNFTNSMFGIYLFHENIFFRELLWNGIFDARNVSNTLMLFEYFLLINIAVFVMGFFLDRVRLFFSIKLDTFFKLIENRTNQIMDSVLDKYTWN